MTKGLLRRGEVLRRCFKRRILYLSFLKMVTELNEWSCDGFSKLQVVTYIYILYFCSLEYKECSLFSRGCNSSQFRKWKSEESMGHYQLLHSECVAKRPRYLFLSYAFSVSLNGLICITLHSYNSWFSFVFCFKKNVFVGDGFWNPACPFERTHCSLKWRGLN